MACNVVLAAKEFIPMEALPMLGSCDWIPVSTLTTRLYPVGRSPVDRRDTVCVIDAVLLPDLPS